MISGTELRNALYGAWRLAHFDRRGLAFFDATPAGFWKSFAAAPIVLPGHALVYLTVRLDAAPAWRVAAVGLIAYVIGWVAFPLLMAGVADLLGRRERYVGFVVATNWAAVLQAAIMVPAVLLRLGDGAAGTAIYFLALAAVLVYGWFVARAALEVEGATAAAIVFASFLLDLLISGVGDTLILRG